jgi:hypothetical protein
MAARQEWSVKYRAVILERDSECRLLRMTEADDAIRRRMGEVEETSRERRRLEHSSAVIEGTACSVR